MLSNADVTYEIMPAMQKNLELVSKYQNNIECPMAKSSALGPKLSNRAHSHMTIGTIKKVNRVNRLNIYNTTQSGGPCASAFL